MTIARHGRLLCDECNKPLKHYYVIDSRRAVSATVGLWGWWEVCGDCLPKRLNYMKGCKIGQIETRHLGKAVRWRSKTRTAMEMDKENES